MTPARLAHLLLPLLPLAPALLLLSACGKEHGRADERRSRPAAPLGFELAMVGAGAAASAAQDTAAPESAPTPVPTPAPLIALSPEELAARLAKGNVRLIDVRTDAEVADGMIPGAEHIPLDRFDPAKLDLSDGREVVLYCRSGRRSALAGEKLAAVTGEAVEHLEGGMLAWEETGQPIEQPQRLRR